MSDMVSNVAALLPMVIAQSAPDFSGRSEMMTVLLGGAALLVITNQAIVFFRNFREQPPPAQTYATKIELQELEAQINLFNQQQEARASKIHTRVDQVLAAVSRLEGKMEGMP